MAEVSTQIREIENICKEITPFFDFSVQYRKKWQYGEQILLKDLKYSDSYLHT